MKKVWRVIRDKVLPNILVYMWLITLYLVSLGLFMKALKWILTMLEVI